MSVTEILEKLKVLPPAKQAAFARIYGKWQKMPKVRRTFSFHAPEAMSVLLVGEFTHWQENPISLKKQKNGTWKGTVSLPPGTYHYRFLVDGEWRDDPEMRTIQPRSANPSRRWPDFLSRLRAIYGDKLTSDSQQLISELRGER